MGAGRDKGGGDERSGVREEAEVGDLAESEGWDLSSWQAGRDGKEKRLGLLGCMMGSEGVIGELYLSNSLLAYAPSADEPDVLNDLHDRQLGVLGPRRRDRIDELLLGWDRSTTGTNLVAVVGVGGRVRRGERDGNGQSGEHVGRSGEGKYEVGVMVVVGMGVGVEREVEREGGRGREGEADGKREPRQSSSPGGGPPIRLGWVGELMTGLVLVDICRKSREGV